MNTNNTKKKKKKKRRNDEEKGFYYKLFYGLQNDAPPSSLMDSNVSPN